MICLTSETVCGKQKYFFKDLHYPSLPVTMFKLQFMSNEKKNRIFPHPNLFVCSLCYWLTLIQFQKIQRSTVQRDIILSIADFWKVWETGTGTGRKEKVTGSRHGEGVKSGNRLYTVYTPNVRGDASKYFADFLGYIYLNIYEDRQSFIFFFSAFEI